MDITCSEKPTVFREHNCELQGTDNVQGQKHIFTPNGGYCIYYPLNLFGNVCSFENWGILAGEYSVT